MTKLGILGAAVVLSSALVASTTAQAETEKHLIAHRTQDVACDPRDPGNPYSQRYDFMSWSAWRRRGGWDTRAEWTCQPIPKHPFGTVF